MSSKGGKSIEIRKCKAAILEALCSPLVVDEIELPQELRFGQVLVKLVYTGICGAQINEIDGVKGADKFLPHLLGHEGSGVVVDVGEGVRQVKPGDHVVLHWRKGNGIESPTPVYSWRGKQLNAGWVTTFNEYAVVSENRLTSIPRNFPMDIAPLFGCAVTTAFGVLNNDARVKIGQSVVIIGVGGVGLALVQGASLIGANPIVAVDIYDDKLALAKNLGATHSINSEKNNLKQLILELTDGKGADVVIDNTGVARVIEQAYDITNTSGKTILVGVPKKGDNISIYSLPLHFEKVLTGSHGGGAEPALDIPRYIGLCQVGKLQLEPLITDRLPFSEINSALEQLRSGQVSGRCILSF